MGREQFGDVLGDNLGEGNCKSKIVARQWGVNFCRETSRCFADLKRKCIQELGSEILLILLRDGPCLELFFMLCSSSRRNCWIQSESY